MAEEARLESVYTPKAYREFESRSLRKNSVLHNSALFFYFQDSQKSPMAQTKKNGKQYAASRLLSFLRRLSPSKIHTYTCHHPQPRLLYGREIVVAVARDVVGLYIYAIFPVVPHHLAVHFRVRMIAVHPLLPS